MPRRNSNVRTGARTFADAKLKERARRQRRLALRAKYPNCNVNPETYREVAIHE